MQQKTQGKMTVKTLALDSLKMEVLITLPGSESSNS
jgi:hypothetical protein